MRHWPWSTGLRWRIRPLLPSAMGSGSGPAGPALCQEPEILVLDEPTSFLDIRYKLEILSTLKELVRQRQLAVVLSLHELDLAQRVSDLVVCVHNNAIERCGPPEAVFTSDYITTLYELTQGSYEPGYGSLELPRVQGAVKAFVIGGNGEGIGTYRRLQRRGSLSSPVFSMRMM